MKHTLALLTSLLLLAPLAALHAAKPLGVGQLKAHASDGEIQLFNGKDLTGWDGNMEFWSVQDGVITGKVLADSANPGKSTLKHHSSLIWRGGKVKDFELTLKYRIVAGISGIHYRSTELPKGKNGLKIKGYKADFGAGKTYAYSGILYETDGRGILAKVGEKTVIKDGDKVTVGNDGKEKRQPNIEVTGSVGNSIEILAGIKNEDWNDYRIVAKGPHLQHFINGKQTVDVTDESSVGAKEGLLALQLHVGAPVTVQYKDFKLVPLK